MLHNHTRRTRAERHTSCEIRAKHADRHASCECRSDHPHNDITAHAQAVSCPCNNFLTSEQPKGSGWQNTWDGAVAKIWSWYKASFKSLVFLLVPATCCWKRRSSPTMAANCDLMSKRTCGCGMLLKQKSTFCFFAWSCAIFTKSA